MRGAMRRLRRLDGPRRRHLLAALRWLAAARAWHARHSAAECFARLRAGPEQGTGALAPPPDLSLVLWSLEAAGKRVPWRADCVVQALAAKFWLERAGVATEFRLGVQRAGTEVGPEGGPGGGLLAHAWLEAEGRPVSGGAPSGALARFAEAGGGPLPRGDAGGR